MARCELLSHVRHPSRPAPVVTLSLPAALFQQLYVSQTSKPRTKEGEKDDRSASCPVCSLRRAVRCGGTCQHHRRGRRDPGGADERDERCLRVRPEQSAERRLRELGSLYRGVSNLPSIANYTVNQTSDGLRRAVAAIEPRGAPSAGLPARRGPTLTRCSGPRPPLRMRTRRTPQQRRQRTALPPSRASCPPTWRARSCTQGPQDTRRCRLSEGAEPAEADEGRGGDRSQQGGQGRRREVRAQGRLGRAGRAAARGGGGRKRAGPGPRSERYPEVAGRNMVELERDAGAARLAMDALRVKGEEAREQLLHATAAANAALAVVDEAQRQRPRAVAPTRRLAVTAPTARSGRCVGRALPPCCCPALTHVAPP
ncbi:hypothetical protein ERJ75_000105500 [Trypanosoma vivax]|nr:hypothetical protein ERJ75_000105500 [Trypanosoma vivax]